LFTLGRGCSLGGQRQRLGRVATAHQAIGEEAGATVAHLPAVGGLGVDALDALRDFEYFAGVDNGFTNFHV
jgi:ribosomal protein S5